MNRRRLACCALLLLLAASCGRKGEEGMSADEVADRMSAMKIEPGQWEAVNEILSVEAPGVPADALREMAGKTTKVSSCVTPEEAAKPSANFLVAQKNSDCAYQDFSLKDGRMTGRMRCTGGQIPGTVTMKIAGDYSSRRYAMNMDMKADVVPGVAMTIKARTTGRRTGDCA